MSKMSSHTNQEIISIVASSKGFSYNGENIFTYVEWNEKGFKVKKGERAFFQTRLWSKGVNKRFIPASLFTIDQVVKAPKVASKELIIS